MIQYNPPATAFSYTFDCDGQLSQFNMYLNHASKKHSFDQYRIAHRTTGSTSWQTSSATTNASSISLPYSGTGVSYDVCIYPRNSTGIDLLEVTDTICHADSSGQSSGTRAETRVIKLQRPLTLSAPPNLAFIKGLEIKTVTFPVAQGGFGTYDYEIVESQTLPDLPTGLSFNESTRRLTGTPTAATSTTQYTYKVTDDGGNGRSATATFNIAVETPFLPSPGNLSFRKGVTIQPVTFPAVTGSGGASLDAHNVNLTYRITPYVPGGLEFNGTTRVLSGTTTMVHNSSTNVFYAAHNGQTGVETNKFTLAVVETLDVPAVSDIYATVGDRINVELPEVTEGFGTKTYKITGAPYNWGNDWPDGPEFGPGLPWSLSFDSSTRVLSGTVHQRVVKRKLAYHATDVDEATGYAVFNLNFADPISLPQPPDVIVVAEDEPIVRIQMPRASGGHRDYYNPYSYSVSNLPFGLWYDRHQHDIYGTPKYTRTSAVTLTARDHVGNQVSRNFNIQVLSCALTLDPLDDRTHQAGVEIEPVTLPAGRGACGDISYQLNGLPGGLEFDPDTRTISGTPDDFDPDVDKYLYNVQYVATDERSSKTVEFTIVVPTVASVCGPNRDAARGWSGDYDSDLDLARPESEAWFKTATPNGRYTLPAATGGQEPYTYVVRGLPDGVCFDPETRAVYGTPPFTSHPTVHRYYPDYLVQDASGEDSRKTWFKINVYD